MTKLTEKELRFLAEFVRRRGQQIQQDAAHGGSISDGGGGALINEVNAFLAGLDGRVPASWAVFAKEAGREADPEYQTYLRLKKRFGEG